MPKSPCFEPLVHAIVSSMDVGVAIADDTGTLVYHNLAIGKILGLHKDKPRTLKDFELINPKKLAYRAAIEAGNPDAISRKNQGLVTYEQTFKKNGEAQHLKFTTGEFDLPGQNKKVRLFMVQDISVEQRLAAVLDQSANGEFITGDPSMLSILDRVNQLAASDASVLLLGESGSGKNLIAQMIHKKSPRSAGPMIEVNCAAIPDALLESELFGHVKGAFTGATQNRPGRFQSAHGGTLFLDEVAEIPLHLQPKLLKALQNFSFEPVGSDRSVDVNVRVIAASNQDLRDAVDRGDFRADLYYRLAVIPLYVPPLRDRPGDIAKLAQHFLKTLANRGYPDDISLSNQALRMLMAYPWPGNVRELANSIEHGVICAENKIIMPDSLSPEIREFNQEHNNLRTTTNEDEQRRSIQQALNQCQQSKSAAAKLLGIDRTTLWRRMQRLGLK
ncbi:MAG: sigma-54 interaction domain-containing protein [bacterium]